MTGTEKSDRSGGPSCEARTDRYVILNGGGWVSNAKSMAMNEAAEHLAAYGGREGPFTAHLIGPAVTFETPEEERARKLEELVIEIVGWSDSCGPNSGRYLRRMAVLARELRDSQPKGTTWTRTRA